MRTGGFGLEQSELYGLGCLGLSKALLKFDKGRGVQLHTFAKKYIKGGILDEVRRRARKGEYAAEKIADIDVGTKGNVERKVEALRMLRILDDKKREVILRNICHDEALSKIGKDLGIHESRVCQIKTAAITELREELGIINA